MRLDGAYRLSLSFQDLILTLHRYWGAQGCVILQPYDMEMGAGTFHPATVLRSLGPDPWRAAYVQPCRRPTDGRYGENPNRLGHYYQYQVVLKPSPDDLQELYLGSLTEIGIDPLKHDIRFVEDDWESPTLGAWGLGWEVWCDGMEVTQFTYFQQVGGFECRPVTGELTYGLERLAMYIQGVDNVFDLRFNDAGVTYGDVFLENEREMSAYNFEVADTEALFDLFRKAAAECERCLEAKLPIPAYEQAIKASHVFNTLQARGVIRVAERQAYIGRVRDLAKAACGAWLEKPSPVREREGAAAKRWKGEECDHSSTPHPARLRQVDPLPKGRGDSDRLPARASLGGNPGADAGEGAQRPCAAVRRMHGEAGLETGAIDVHSTPRRLVLIARDVAEPTEASREEMKGPRTSAPPQALEGFLRKTGLTREQLEERDGVYFAVDRAGRPRRGRDPRRDGQAHRRRFPLAQVDALGQRHACAGCGRCTASSRCSAKTSCRSRSTASPAARPRSATASIIRGRSPSAARPIMPRSCAPAT